MSKRINIIGKKFNRLLVLKFLYSNNNRQSIYLCKCDCNKLVYVYGSNMKKGHTKSCGCILTEFNKNRTIVTSNNQKAYNTWRGIKERCYNKNNNFYKYYGRKGIHLCKKWTVFKDFLEDMGIPKIGMVIHRKNSNKNYYKGNCIWMDRSLHATYHNINRKTKAQVLREKEK